MKPSGHIVEIPLRAGPSPCPACLSKQHKLDAIREENLDLPRNHTGKRVRKRLLAFFQYTGLPVLAGMRKLLSYGTTTASTVTWTRTRVRISTADRGSAEHQSHTTKLNATTVSRHSFRKKFDSAKVVSFLLVNEKTIQPGLLWSLGLFVVGYSICVCRV